jgi:predicted Zn-dependent protease
VTSSERKTLGESSETRESNAARPIPAGVGFAAGSRGSRDALVIVALLVATAFVMRASLGPVTEALVARVPTSVDEEVGARLAAVQRATSTPIEDVRAMHLRDLVGVVEPHARAAVGAAAPLGALRVTLLDSSEVNAFALPGGQVFVLRGLLEAKGVTDDTLVGILAHEFAHAALRHGVRGIVRRNLVRTAAVVLVGGLDAGTVALVGGGLSLGDLAYDRAMEDEADEVAGRVLRAAGRPVEPLAAFLEGLDALGPTVAILTNHPAGRDRAARLRAQAIR